MNLYLDAAPYGWSGRPDFAITAGTLDNATWRRVDTHLEPEFNCVGWYPHPQAWGLRTEHLRLVLVTLEYLGVELRPAPSASAATAEALDSARELIAAARELIALVGADIAASRYAVNERRGDARPHLARLAGA